MNESLSDDWLYDTVMLQLLGTAGTAKRKKKVNHTVGFVGNVCDMHFFVLIPNYSSSKLHHHFKQWDFIVNSLQALKNVSRTCCIVKNVP